MLLELNEAHNVCFIGCGFHKENWDILQCSKVLTENKNITATRFEVQDAEWQRKTNHIPNKKLLDRLNLGKAPAHLKSMEALRETHYIE